MEHLVKITQEYKLENSQLWKYEFLDIQTNQEDRFYHDNFVLKSDTDIKVLKKIYELLKKKFE